MLTHINRGTYLLILSLNHFGFHPAWSRKCEHWTQYSSNVFCFTWSWYYECFTDGFWRGEINVCAIIVIYCHCEKATVPDSVSCKHPFPWICLVFLKLTFPIKYVKINTCANLFYFSCIYHELWFSTGFASKPKILHWPFGDNTITNMYFRAL